MVYGAGKAGAQISESLKKSNDYSIVGFIDDDKTKTSTIVNSIEVFGFDSINELIRDKSAKSLILAIVKMLEFIVKEYSYEILIDDALYNLAKIFDYQYNNDEKASEFYQELILNHEGSIYTSEARERFRLLRGDNLIEEL